jgi:hypothetical protein
MNNELLQWALEPLPTLFANCKHEGYTRGRAVGLLTFGLGHLFLELKTGASYGGPAILLVSKTLRGQANELVSALRAERLMES